MPEHAELAATGASVHRNPETLLWQAFLDVHGLVFSRLNRALGGEFGLTLAKFDVMAQLFSNPDGLTQGNLSRQLKVTGGNVTGLVRRMVKDGLITREMSPCDRRSFVVRLTPSGEGIYLNARARHDALLENWFRAIDEGDKADATRILRDMGRRSRNSGKD